MNNHEIDCCCCCLFCFVFFSLSLSLSSELLAQVAELTNAVKQLNQKKEGTGLLLLLFLLVLVLDEFIKTFGTNYRLCFF